MYLLPFSLFSVNRFERPQIIQNPSKQALSNMLRSRHPFMGVQGNTSGGFGMQNQQPNPMQTQPQQQRSAANAQQFIRMRGPAGPNQLGNQSVGMVAQPGGLIGQPVMVGQTGVGGINQLIGTNMGTSNNMLSQQSNVINPNSMLGQQGQNVNMSMGGQNAQNSGMMNQNSNMMTNSSGVGNPNMVQIQGGLNQNSGIVGNMGMMQGQQQANANMMGQQGMGGMQNMQQVGSNATVPQQQQQMFQNQQYQNMNQQYQGYNQPQQQQAAMNQQQQNVVQQNMMGNQFGNAIGQQPQRSTQAEYMTQQRVALANRNQYATMQQQQAPNVTMNNMVGGPQGTAPPYPHNVGRQGKPNINAAVNQGNMGPQQQQFHQQQQQQQRMRQMQILQQQQQQGNPQNMPQNQGQVMNPQQTPALLAQLQRNQQQNMMGQQYSHQPPPY